MIKDILGEILDAKKGKATVVINFGEIEQEGKEGTEEEELKKQGLAPVLKDEESDKAEMMDEEAIMNGDEREMMAKKKSGVKPRNLAERAKMELLD